MDWITLQVLQTTLRVVGRQKTMDANQEIAQLYIAENWHEWDTFEQPLTRS